MNQDHTVDQLYAHITQQITERESPRARSRRALNKVAVTLILASLWGAFMSGCAPSLRDRLHSRTLSAPLSREHPIMIDVRASEIIWDHEVVVTNFRPRELRASIARALEDALNRDYDFKASADEVPARYRLEVLDITNTRQWWVVPCFIYFTVFGCPTHSQSAEITLSLDYQGQIYSASTVGRATFNIYNYVFFNGRSELSPVADALGRAVRKIAAKVRRRDRENARLQSKSALPQLSTNAQRVKSLELRVDLQQAPVHIAQGGR